MEDMFDYEDENLLSGDTIGDLEVERSATEDGDFSLIWIKKDYEGKYSFAASVEQAIDQGFLPKPAFKLPKSFLSVSQVETYLKCPKSYEFRYVQGVVVPKSLPLIQGSAIHKAIEVGYNFYINEVETPDFDLLWEAYTAEFNESIKDGLVGDDYDPVETEDQAEKFLKLWVEKKLEKVNPVGIEKPFITSFHNSSMMSPGTGLVCVGVIDLLDGPKEDQEPEFGEEIPPASEVTTVVDNKVVKRKIPQSDADNSLQLSIYSAATQYRDLRLDMFVKTKVPKLEEVYTVRGEGDDAWAAQVVMTTANAISQGVFPFCSPTSWACSEKWCGFWQWCRGARR